MNHLLDLETYPLDRPDSPEYAALVASCRKRLAEDGMFDLPGFLRPEVTKAAAEILETARAIESQVKVLYAACRRDEPTVERSNAREAVTAALRECVAGLASAIRPIDLDGALAAISLDASFEGDADQIAVAIRQAMSIHRGRARGPIGVEVTMTTENCR